jgi:CRISPR-associated protein Csc2
MTLENLQNYQKYFVSKIPRTPTNRYVSVVLLRETQSYAIFTTEGGEQQDVEQVKAGLTHNDHIKSISRLVMFKRKQVAPERRTGKALLRQYGIFPYTIQNGEVLYGEEAAQAKKVYTDCYLTEGLCTHCPDCLIYGYAAIEGEGARKARLMTDSCFTIRPYEIIQKQVKFNVIDEAKQTSGTITEYDYTTPGVFLPSVETTVDLTVDEFIYVLGNVLRTTRYGKESSRQGVVRNHVAAIAFSDVELFANLEFTQALYDAFANDADVDLVNGTLSIADFQRHTGKVIKRLTADLPGRVELVMDEALKAILKDVRKLNKDDKKLTQFLRKLNTQSATFVV